ncbi:MAG: S46 family peptidase [Bacteroidales bacterium]|nr:S46 family peptidase [Bacteroidales bacterium]MDZ4203836.1 S46 family peptidase [Bacteroidales bacterium]
MKRLFLIMLVSVLASHTHLRADEGMWIPMLVQQMVYDDMSQMGMKLTPEQIYSINESSVKDAIVIFGRGCTGEIISGEGLLLTNHHCGYGVIQSHSTIEADYLTDGFWAMTRAEEIASPGLTATFLIRMEDVTAKVLGVLNDNMTPQERSKAVSDIAGKLTKEATEGTHYSANVRPFFNGNEYYMLVFETYRDVRLAGAPPSSIGKYGADTDNWMWPRHTGDFSLFRVYAGPDNKPADYSQDNVPFKPRHFLPVSVAGVQKGDFSFIMGYPGSTDRYLTSWGVKMAIEQSNPAVVKIREKKLAIMREDMDASDKVRIQYASKYAGTSNYWKYFIGQTRGLKRLKVFDKKQAIEDDFNRWVQADPARKAKYGETLGLIKSAYEQMEPHNLAQVYYREALMRGPEILSFASQYQELLKQLNEKAEKEKLDRTINNLKQRAESYFKNYSSPTDQKLLGAMMTIFYSDIPMQQQPDVMNALNGRFKGGFDAYAAFVFGKSVFATKERLMAFLAKPNAKLLAKDPAFMLASDLLDFGKKINEKMTPPQENLSKGNRLLVAGLRDMSPEKKFYPDANSTMRLTYGQVLDYFPADAVHYDYKTTLKGVMEKEDADNWEFIVPAKLIELYENKDYGIFGANGEMITCFITNHDITGGNSGSPVINGKGELIGLAFDGNWEAMSGDIAFEPDLQRTINVDIRYVLFIIDKYASAGHLINEMVLVR